MKCVSSVLGIIIILCLAQPANACGRVSDEVALKIKQSHSRDRRKADVVILGRWIDGQNHEACGVEENLCVAKVIPDKILRGKRLPEYIMHYPREFNMCDMRDYPPNSGTYGKYYLNGSSDYGFSLVDKDWKDKK